MKTLKDLYALLLRAALIFTLSTLIPEIAMAQGGQTIFTNWRGGNGNWTDANWRFSPDPNRPVTFPNNQVDLFNVTVVGSEDLSLDSNIKVNELVVLDNNILNIERGGSLTIGGGGEVSGGSSGRGDIHNYGDINLGFIEALPSGTLIVGKSEVSLSQGGNVFMKTTESRILGAMPKNRLINGDNKIQGVGSIGANSMRLTNRGMISADKNEGRLIIDPTDGENFNTGTFEARNGGILALQDGKFFNGGGIIKALDASTVDFIDVEIRAGIFETEGNGVIRNTSDAKLFNIFNQGDFEGVDGSSTTIEHGILNIGELSLNSTGSTTEFKIMGEAFLSGAGRVRLSDNQNNRIIGMDGTSKLIIDEGQTIQGAGSIGVDQLAVENNGKIVATSPFNPLIIDPNAIGVTNTGTLEAILNSTLRLQNGTFNNTDGTNHGRIEASSGGIVELSNAVVNGGELKTVGTGVIRNLDSAIVEGVVVRNAGIFDFADGSNIDINGLQNQPVDLANPGTIRLNSNLDSTRVGIGTSVNLTGGGRISMSNSTGNLIIGANGSHTWTNVDNTVSGAGTISGLNLKNEVAGVIEANGTNGLRIESSPIQSVENKGTLNIKDGSKLDIDGKGFTNFSNQTLTDGTYKIGGTFEFEEADIRTNASNIILDGQNGKIVDQLGQDGLRNLDTNNPEGKFRIQGGNNFMSLGDFGNEGDLTIGEESVFTVGGGAADFTTVGSLTVNGALNAVNLNINGGTFGGSGTVSGNVNNSGNVGPGNSPGILGITGHFTQTSTSVLAIEIGGLIAGSEYDQVQIGGLATLGGILDVSLINGFLPTVGDQFEILQYNSIFDDFDTFLGLNLGGGLFLEPIVSSKSYILETRFNSSSASIPEPSTYLLFAFGLMSLGLRKWRK